MEDKGEAEWRRTGSSTAAQSEMMRGSVRERGKEGIFKPRCLFSFRRGVCLGVCVRACVIRVPPPSSSSVLLDHQRPLAAAL